MERVKRKERDKFIAFYVSEDEKLAIVDCAKKNDLSVSDYCRKMLLRNSQKELVFEGE